MRPVDVTISCVTPADAAEVAPALITLLAELSPSNAALNTGDVVERLLDERLRVVIATDSGAVIGAATLTTLVTVPDGLVGRVEDVVVSAAARGGGVGRRLMEALHDEARQLEVTYLELTSRPSREAANALYQALGYVHRDTNVYRLRLAD